MGKTDFKYEGVGYNGPHLAGMPFDKFKEEVKHHFTTGPNQTERIQDLYDKIRKKFPQAAQAKPTTFLAPKTDEEAAKPLEERDTPAQEGSQDGVQQAQASKPAAASSPSASETK